VVNRTKTLGANAELPEVNARTSRMAWFRTRMNVNGPAYLRDLWRRPMIKYKNLSEEEVARIHKTRADKTLWNRILQGCVLARSLILSLQCKSPSSPDSMMYMYVYV
jgi:hypothetical protein